MHPKRSQRLLVAGCGRKKEGDPICEEGEEEARGEKLEAVSERDPCRVQHQEPRCLLQKRFGVRKKGASESCLPNPPQSPPGILLTTTPYSLLATRYSLFDTPYDFREGPLPRPVPRIVVPPAEGVRCSN